MLKLDELREDAKTIEQLRFMASVVNSNRDCFIEKSIDLHCSEIVSLINRKQDEFCDKLSLEIARHQRS